MTRRVAVLSSKLCLEEFYRSIWPLFLLANQGKWTDRRKNRPFCRQKLTVWKRRPPVLDNNSPMRLWQQMRSFVHWRRPFLRSRPWKSHLKVQAFRGVTEGLEQIQSSLVSLLFKPSTIRQMYLLQVSRAVFFECSIIYCASSCKTEDSQRPLFSACIHVWYENIFYLGVFL